MTVHPNTLTQAHSDSLTGSMTVLI